MTEETVANEMMSGESSGMPFPEDGVTLVFLEGYEVPGFTVYRRGDIATFERRVAKEIVAVGRSKDDHRPVVAMIYKPGMELPESDRMARTRL